MWHAHTLDDDDIMQTQSKSNLEVDSEFSNSPLSGFLRRCRVGWGFWEVFNNKTLTRIEMSVFKTTIIHFIKAAANISTGFYAFLHICFSFFYWIIHFICINFCVVQQHYLQCLWPRFLCVFSFVTGKYLFPYWWFQLLLRSHFSLKQNIPQVHRSG